jgi:hypothetical protein
MPLLTTTNSAKAREVGVIEFKLVRCFSLGFTIFSPTLNGFVMSIDVACFSIMLRGHGKGVKFTNYWR